MSTLDKGLPFASYSEGRIHVSLANGVDFSFPISGNERFEGATPEQLSNIVISSDGLHWPAIDEDLAFEGLLRGDYGQFVHRQRALTRTE